MTGQALYKLAPCPLRKHWTLPGRECKHGGSSLSGTCDRKAAYVSFMRVTGLKQAVREDHNPPPALMDQIWVELVGQA